MNESSKKKEKITDVSSKRSKLAGAVGVVETPSQSDEDAQERINYWKDSIETIRGESFGSVEAAVDRVVELSSEKLGILASDPETRAFMKEAIMGNEEILHVLHQVLEIS